MGFDECLFCESYFTWSRRRIKSWGRLAACHQTLRVWTRRCWRESRPQSWRIFEEKVRGCWRTLRSTEDMSKAPNQTIVICSTINEYYNSREILMKTSMKLNESTEREWLPCRRTREIKPELHDRWKFNHKVLGKGSVRTDITQKTQSWSTLKIMS